jgi:hypothetical protein
LGYPRRAVNAQPLSPNVRFGRARISGADLLTTSFRVAYWPGSPDDIALGEWSKLEHRAYIVRGPGNGNESPIEAMDADSPPPSVFDASSLAPLSSSSSSSANIRLGGEPPSSKQQQHQPLSLNYVRGAQKVGETSMSPVRVDSNRCLAEPGYNPWSVHGVNVRSGCFGSTPDCLYSVSREFFRRDSMREFVVVVSGTTSGATFTNFALYASGSQMSSAVSARDIRVIAAIDDRSFATRSIPGTTTAAFVAAFASSPDGCERAAPTPCAVARAPPSRRSHIFIVGRDYLDPITATAPVNRPAVRVEIFAIA